MGGSGGESSVGAGGDGGDGGGLGHARVSSWTDRHRSHHAEALVSSLDLPHGRVDPGGEDLLYRVKKAKKKKRLNTAATIDQIVFQTIGKLTKRRTS